MEKGKGSLKEDKLVEALVPDPSQPDGDRVMLRGQFGRSPRTAHWRLYLNADLTEYVEIAEQDILHRESLATADSPLGGSLVWVKRGSRVQHVRSLPEVVDDPFDIVVSPGGVLGPHGGLGGDTSPGSYRSCADSCQGTCYSSCQGTCSGSCDGTCSQSCGGTCSTCASTCDDTCGATCGGCSSETCPTCTDCRRGSVTGDVCRPSDRGSRAGDPVEVIARAERILAELQETLLNLRKRR